MRQLSHTIETLRVAARLRLQELGNFLCADPLPPNCVTRTYPTHNPLPLLQLAFTFGLPLLRRASQLDTSQQAGDSKDPRAHHLREFGDSYFPPPVAP